MNRVGLGTFPLAGVFRPISSKDAGNIVRKFIDLGGYYIDTAPMYGFGKVESLLGKALKSYSREEYYVATKCGYIDVEGKNFKTIQKSGAYDDIIKECEKSLKRLGLDYIDLYINHSPDTDTPFEETMEAMIELQKQGKIKEIGVSNVNLEELKEYNKSARVRFIQNRYSLINRSINAEYAKYLNRENIQLIPYQVIDRGQLTGSVFEGVGNLKDADLRKGRPEWQEEKLNIISEWIKNTLSPIAKNLGITIGQLSISWALAQPYMGFVIVGTTNPEYIRINLASDEIKLDESVLKEVDEAYKNLEDVIKTEYGISIREFRGLNEKYY